MVPAYTFQNPSLRFAWQLASGASELWLLRRLRHAPVVPRGRSSHTYLNGLWRPGAPGSTKATAGRGARWTPGKGTARQGCFSFSASAPEWIGFWSVTPWPFQSKSSSRRRLYIRTRAKKKVDTEKLHSCCQVALDGPGIEKCGGVL